MQGSVVYIFMVTIKRIKQQLDLSLCFSRLFTHHACMPSVRTPQTLSRVISTIGTGDEYSTCYKDEESRMDIKLYVFLFGNLCIFLCTYLLIRLMIYQLGDVGQSFLSLACVVLLRAYLARVGFFYPIIFIS